MKKIINIFISALLIFTLSSVLAFANVEESAPMDYAAIDDGADLFTSSEEIALLAVIQDYKETYNFDVTLVTRSSIGAVDALDYADDYELVDDNSDGLLFLLNTGTREYVTSTRNLGETIFNENAFDRVDEVVVEYLREENYYGAFVKHLEITGDVLLAYSNGEEYKVPFDLFGFISEIISEGILAGVIFAAIVTFFVNSFLKAEMNTARKSTDANSYIQSGSFNLTGNSDRFLFQNVTRKAKPKQTSSSSGSTRSSYNSRGSSRTSRKGGY